MAFESPANILFSDQVLERKRQREMLLRLVRIEFLRSLVLKMSKIAAVIVIKSKVYYHLK